MRLALLVSALAVAFAVLPASGAAATSITAAPRHDEAKGCAAIKRLIANLNAGRLKERHELLGPTFFSDSFGKVEGAEEEAAFLHSLRHSEGRPDRKPINLYHVYRVHKDKYGPIYLVVLERQSWHEKRYESDDMLTDREVHDPHYALDTSYWLVGFSSNDIQTVREAGEMYPLMDDSTELKDCWEY